MGIRAWVFTALVTFLPLWAMHQGYDNTSSGLDTYGLLMWFSYRRIGLAVSLMIKLAIRKLFYGL